MTELLRQLDAAATGAFQAEHGHRHPTQTLWRTLAEGLKSQGEYQPELAAPIIVDIMKRYLGAYHSKTLEWFTVMTFLMDESDEIKEARLRSLCSAMDHLGTFDERHLGVRMNLIAQVRKNRSKLEDAAQLASEILDDPHRNKELRKYPNAAYNFVSLLAEIRQLQGNLPQAEKLYWDCLGIAKAKLEINESDLPHALRHLEEILRAQDKNDEADVVAEERRLAIKESLERVGEEEGTP